MLVTEPTEVFHQINIDGDELDLEIFGEPREVMKIIIGDRFNIAIRCYPAGGSIRTNQCIDFFKNYACLLSWDELKLGWKCYNKALRQRSDTTSNAFWHYFEGDKLRFHDRKKTVFSWVTVSSLS